MPVNFFLAALVLAGSWLASCGNLPAAESGEKAKPLCPVSGKPVNPAISMEYKGGKVYFCDPKCKEAFQANRATYGPWANYQLVITGQAKQVNCPFTGKPISPKIAPERVSEVVVKFCCVGCKNTVARAKDPKERLRLVFGEPFDTAFVVKGSDK